MHQYAMNQSNEKYLWNSHSSGMRELTEQVRGQWSKLSDSASSTSWPLPILAYLETGTLTSDCGTTGRQLQATAARIPGNSSTVLAVLQRRMAGYLGLKTVRSEPSRHLKSASRAVGLVAWHAGRTN